MHLLDKNFKDWVISIKEKYRNSQIKAAVHVNSELISFYFELGREISQTSYKKEYGSKFYEKLSFELKNQIPRGKGFSESNLRICENFYIFYCKKQILEQVVPELRKINKLSLETKIINILGLVPWGHHKCILDKCKTLDKALFYIKKTIQNNWSRSVLLNYLDSNLYEREGKSISNFNEVGVIPKGDLSNELLKDPYDFGFLGLTDEYNERQLVDSLMNQLQKFILELGKGFAFVGREYKVQVQDTELFIDLLFYNYILKRFFVFEIKTTDFKPEYLGQLNGYVNCTNHLIKQDSDNDTVGILICKNKNNTLVKYCLEGYKNPMSISQYEINKVLPNEVFDQIEFKNKKE